MASMSSSYSPCLTLPDGMDPVDLVETVYDLIKDIKDPEKPETLEQLNVVHEDLVTVSPLNFDTCLIEIQFVPTVPHCSLATLIGLCLRTKVDQCLPQRHRKLLLMVRRRNSTSAEEVVRFQCLFPNLRRVDVRKDKTLFNIPMDRHLLDNCLMIDIRIKQGTHDSAKEINKQINDKERVAAALENPSLLKLVNECIKDSDR